MTDGLRGEQGIQGERGPVGRSGLMGLRQKIAIALILVGCIGLSVTIFGVVHLVSTVQHQGTKIEMQQGEIRGLVTALDANVKNQVANRTANVYTWCDGINAGRDYDRSFIASFKIPNLSYTLGDLPCKTLATKTAKSAQHH